MLVAIEYLVFSGTTGHIQRAVGEVVGADQYQLHVRLERGQRFAISLTRILSVREANR